MEEQEWKNKSYQVTRNVAPLNYLSIVTPVPCPAPDTPRETTADT